MKKMRILMWVLLLVGTLASVACKGGGIKEDPILRLSAEEALVQGKDLMENKKYNQAAQYFDHAFEVAPNSATGREALLLAADSYFLNKGTANSVKAEAKYRDYLNRFPTSDRSDYVQLRIASCLAEQMGKPDRDQSATLKALTAFESVQQLYPTSSHAAEVEAKIVEIRHPRARLAPRRRDSSAARRTRISGWQVQLPPSTLYCGDLAFGVDRGGLPRLSGDG